MQRAKKSFNGMKCLDIFMNSLSHEEYQKKRFLLHDFNGTSIPIISGDFHLKNLDSFPLNEDIITLNHLGKKYNWKNNMKSILDEKYYEALILTDISKTILWVNEGFSEMTGYSKEFVLHKTPEFLQGEETQKEVKKRIEKNLTVNKPFKEVILNYRKDKTPYKCEITIFPLSTEKETTHYLALERKVV